jgi:hypothetical protein
MTPGRVQSEHRISNRRQLARRNSMSRDDVLVSADWAEKNLGAANVVFVEVDEDTTAYDGGHIQGAVKINWKTELQDQVRRDFVNKEQFEELLSGKGISNDDTVVLYGGNNNRTGTSSCTATRTSGCSTAAARSGSWTTGPTPPRCRSARPPATPRRTRTSRSGRSATTSSRRSAR